MKSDNEYMTRDRFIREFKEYLPEFLEEFSTAETREEFQRSSGVCTPPGLPFLVPYGESLVDGVRLARFDTLEKCPERVRDAVAYLTRIGMASMERLAAHFQISRAQQEQMNTFDRKV